MVDDEWMEMYVTDTDTTDTDSLSIWMRWMLMLLSRWCECYAMLCLYSTLYVRSVLVGSVV
jgi:hypothetical protein